MELVECSTDAVHTLNGPAVSIHDIHITTTESGIQQTKNEEGVAAKAFLGPDSTQEQDESEQEGLNLSARYGDSGLPLDNEPVNDSDDEWEDESLYEEALDGLSDETHHSDRGLEACSLPEALTYRAQLRTLGAERFVEDTVFSGKISARKLCTAFGILPPAFLEGCPDESYYQLLGMGISRELQKRVKLPQYNSLDDAAMLLRKAQKVIVLTGAGISTSLGIPDFRSTNTGLYSQLAAKGLSEPEEVFDIHMFREDPSVFYSIAKDILPPTSSDGKTRYTPTHAFIRLLQDKSKLLTNYTQNIDNIEAAAGIEKDKLIQCHGSFAWATCQECRHKVPGEAIYPEIRRGAVPNCKECVERLRISGTKRKRAADIANRPNKKRNWEDDSEPEGDEDYSLAVAGIMKPDITFFGEALPATFRNRITDHDRDQVDLVIVIGTSLKVAPVADVPNIVPADVPQIYINKTRCSHVDFDIEMRGDCDLVIAELARRVGWELPLYEDQTPENFSIQPLEGSQHQWVFTCE